MRHTLLNEVHQLFLGEEIQRTDLHELFLIVIDQLINNKEGYIYTTETQFSIIQPAIPKAIREDITYADFEKLVGKCFMAHALTADRPEIEHTKPIKLEKSDYEYFQRIAHEWKYTE